MGDISDFVSISNSLEIGDLRERQGQQMRLAEFRERGDTLARMTGVVASGFFGFEKAHPTPREHYPAGKWIGLAFGGLLGAAFMNPATAVAGAAIGFGLGTFAREPETRRLDRAMNTYDRYLTEVETAAVAQAQARAAMVSATVAPPVPTTRHAETLLAQREEQAALASSTGHTIH